MVNLETLRARGLRAYEVGRLTTAARIGFVLVPVTVLCWAATDRRGTCACLGVVALGLAVWLRWKDRAGVEDVRAGFRAGIVPLAMGLALTHWIPACPFAQLAPFCSALGVTAGFIGGIWVALGQGRRRIRLRNWLSAIAVGVLLGSLGCLQLGASGLLGVAAGIVVGAGAGALLAPRPR